MPKLLSLIKPNIVGGGDLEMPYNASQVAIVGLWIPVLASLNFLALFLGPSGST